MSTRSIYFFSEGISFTLKQKARIREWIGKVALHHGFTLGALNYIFVSDEHLLEMNKAHLQHDYYTDILTFPLESPDSRRISGDIYISIDRVQENAVTASVAFDDELHRVMIHGVLHLMGFDDHGNEEKAMREREDHALTLR